MEIELRVLTPSDIEAHNAGEDAETVRWLTGGQATVETTAAHIDMLARNIAQGEGKRGFGVWLDGTLAGYVDCDPQVGDGLDVGDVNVSYAVHPWARGRGVAVEAVRLICDVIAEQGIGSAAAIRVHPENRASVRVAEKAGFRFVREFTSSTDTLPDGTPAMLHLFRRELTTAPPPPETR